jgi:hypothetical protein
LGQDKLDDVPVHLFSANYTNFHECRHQRGDGPIPGSFSGKKWVNMFMQKYSEVVTAPPEATSREFFRFRVFMPLPKPASTN